MCFDMGAVVTFIHHGMIYMWHMCMYVCMYVCMYRLMHFDMEDAAFYTPRYDLYVAYVHVCMFVCMFVCVHV